MGGRLLDFLGQGIAADRPDAATVPSLIPVGSAAVYYAYDTGIFSFFNEDAVAWVELDLAALSAIGFQNLADVDWTTPPTDGQFFVWDNTAGKFVPADVPAEYTDTDADARVAAGIATHVGEADPHPGYLTPTEGDAAYAPVAHVGSGGGAHADAVAAGASGFMTGADKAKLDGVAAGATNYTDGDADARIAAASIDYLSDVDTTTTPPTDGQVLKWNNGNSEWEPGDASVVGAIDDLSDVDTSTTPPTDGQALVWDDGNSEWIPGDVAAGGPQNFVQIAQVVVSVAQATIDFTGIPADYEDLVLTAQGRCTNAADDNVVQLRFNNDSGTNYNYVRENRAGTGGGGDATLIQIGEFCGSTGAAGVGGGIECQIQNYKRTTLHKTLTSQNAHKSGGTPLSDLYYQRISGFWKNTAAINRITLTMSAGNFEVGTVVTLYGRGGASSSGTPSNIGDLGDVDTATVAPVAGDSLRFDGTDWVPEGSGFELIDSWSYTVNVTEVDFTNLAGYTELFVIARNITLAASATRLFRLSVDNGVSFYAGASDYQTIASTGVESGSTAAGSHSTAASAARTIFLQASGINISGAPKPLRSPIGDRLFVGSTNPVNAVRFTTDSGTNITGGDIYVFGRK